MSTILEILQGRRFSICHIFVQQGNAEHASPSEDGKDNGFVLPQFLASRHRSCRPLAPSAGPIPVSSHGPAIVIVAAVPVGGFIAAIPPLPTPFVSSSIRLAIPSASKCSVSQIVAAAIVAVAVSKHRQQIDNCRNWLRWLSIIVCSNFLIT